MKTKEINWVDFPRLMGAVCPNLCDELIVWDQSFERGKLGETQEVQGQAGVGSQAPVRRVMTDRDSVRRVMTDRDLVSDLSIWMSMPEDDSSSDEDAETTVSRDSKKVSFSTLEIREYDVTLGDHPFCRDGLPMSLDWNYNEVSTVLDVHPYEEVKAIRPAQKLDFKQRFYRLRHTLQEEGNRSHIERLRQQLKLKKSM